MKLKLVSQKLNFLHSKPISHLIRAKNLLDQQLSISFKRKAYLATMALRGALPRLLSDIAATTLPVESQHTATETRVSW